MKFFCEYCGNMIDANKDAKCPNCGASYKKNKSYLKLHEEKSKEDQQNKEFKQQVMNHTLGAMKFSKWFMFIPIIIFVIIFSIVIFSFINFNKGFNNESNKIKTEVETIFDKVTDKIEQQQNEKLPVVEVSGEYVSTEKYQFKVTKYEVIEDRFNAADEGYELVKFHFVVENLADYEISREDVNCIVDGIAQNNDVYSGHSDLPFHIAKGLTVKGTSTFIVPENATSYDIRYGDYITVHIEK